MPPEPPHARTRRRALAAAAAVLALAAPAARAQIVVGPMLPAPPIDDGLWRGSGGAAATLNAGNNDSATVALSADAVRATPRDRITLAGTLNYGRSEVDDRATTTADRWNASGRYDYNLTPRTFVFGRLGVERDRVVALDRRDTLESGLGWKLVDRGDASFSLFSGLGRSVDRYAEQQTLGRETGTRFHRTTLALAEESLLRLTPSVEWRQRLDVAPTISGDRTTLVRFSSTLAVALNSTLALTVMLADQYNSRPPVGVQRNDLMLFTGINVRFGAAVPTPLPVPPPPTAPPPPVRY